MKNIILAIIVYLLSAGAVQAQADWIIVDQLTFTGNKRTRTAVILRELPFAVGDTILLADLPAKLLAGERQLLNTGLFMTAAITYKKWEGATQRIHLEVDLLEAWYIYPIPKFELADRNFNVWWKEQNRSLKRVNVGLKFDHLNFTGWGDKFEVGFEYGYTRSFEVSYNLPYLNKAQTLGLFLHTSYSRNREINYLTAENKQLFFNNETNFVRSIFYSEAGLSWRPALYGQHNATLGYHQNWVDPTVVQEYNPGYFEDGKNKQRFFRLLYGYRFDLRDNRAYPWAGYQLGGFVEKDGLGVFGDRNALTVNLFAEKYWPLGKQWSFSLATRTKYSLIRQPQSYQFNRGIGFGRNRISGYELYVIDGLDMALLRSNLRFQIWRGNISFGKWVFIDSFRELPFRFNLSLSNDLGIVNDPFGTRSGNPLNNQLLWGGGLGLDFVFYYDFVFRLQYSVNELGEGGFFLDFNIEI
ncbi:MAG: hypothetical protein DA408_02210 [Bacteroidetes bacterium]|nr:MAG: hypothetical protein C7N36_00895 [Bacteroidota bacterium]PTM14626.1 MAG: hypothetical protein DA408_02210 [Bacteroidota bacterium]